MKVKKQIKIIAVLLGLTFSLTSCGVVNGLSNGDNGYYIQSAAQGYLQGSSGGTYLGTASSESEASNLAKSKGYTKYQWYPSTENVFGY